jgi:hypothetical protein
LALKYGSSVLKDSWTLDISTHILHSART